MATCNLLVDEHEVILGTSAGDGGATVIVTAMTFDVASETAAALNKLRLATLLDPALVSGKAFYVRLKAGTQTIPVTMAGANPTLGEIKTALQGQPASPAVYLKHDAPAGEIRVTSFASDKFLQFVL
jgi:hypothetical protein